MDRSGCQFVDQLALAVWTSHNLYPLWSVAVISHTVH